MTGKTHLAAGLLCGEAIVLTQNITRVSEVAFVIAAAAVGSLLPDIDHPQSMMATSNRTTRTVSSVVSSVTQHRGFTHTLAFSVLMWFLAMRLAAHLDAISNYVVMSLTIGLFSHLFLDTLNEKGVMWFWPVYRKHIHVMKIRTGSSVEGLLRLIINLAATVGIGMILVEQVKLFHAP